MQVKIDGLETGVATALCEDRRMQLKALLMLHTIHEKSQAKQLLDTFPYQEGRDIPLVRKRGSDTYLVWSCSSHLDLIHDLSDRYTWMQRPLAQDNEPLKSRAFTRNEIAAAHSILKKVENVSGVAYKEYTEELLEDSQRFFKGLKTFDSFAAECLLRADKQTTDIIVELVGNFPLSDNDDRSPVDYLKEALNRVKEIPTVG